MDGRCMCFVGVVSLGGSFTAILGVKSELVKSALFVPYYSEENTQSFSFCLRETDIIYTWAEGGGHLRNYFTCLEKERNFRGTQGP